MSSNDRGDEPRVTPSVSSRQRPNRPTSGAQRVDNDPRSEAPRERPDSVTRNGNGSSNGNGNGSSNGNGHGKGSGVVADTGVVRRVDAAPDNVVAIDATTATTPKRPSRRAKPQRPGAAPPLTDAVAETVDAPHAPGVSPITGPVAVPAVGPTIAPPAGPSTGPSTGPSAGPPASPVTSPVVVVPAAHVAPPGPPPPIALAPAPLPHAVPQVMPLPPSVFDDEAHRTGAMSFEGLFDPEADAAGVPRRQRAVQFTQTGRRSRPRLRRVTRVVRHVDPWSVFKVALCFSLVLYGVCLTAGVLLWNVAYTTGTIDNVQRFFESFGWDTFRFKGGELFHNAWIAGLFAALGLTGLIVLAVTLFNLITDLVGGIRVTVLEEEVVERNPVVRGPLLRRRSRAVSMITPDREFADEADSPDSAAHLG